MIYGDGPFNQPMLDDYYRRFYGYGLGYYSNNQRLTSDARMIAASAGWNDVIVDFGGAGEDGRSVLVDTLRAGGFLNALCIGPGEPLPPSNIIYASHVIEHVYDLPETMRRLTDALQPDGLLIIDGPDATGLLQRWKMPILDFNTKHINHFTLRDYLNLGHRYGLESMDVRKYELENAPAYQIHFKRLDVAERSREHVQRNITARVEALRAIDRPVNVWGMSDVTWHLLAQVELDVLDYIDNDPAYRGQTYNGKLVLERPTNDAPIVIMAQGQRARLIANIRKMGIESEIIEI
jgi:hypothetical protein